MSPVGVPPQLGGGAPGGFGGGGGGGRGGGAPANPDDLAARTAQVKQAVLTFHDWPSDSILKRYNDVKLALPKAITDANSFLVTKAMPLSQALKKYDMTLTVPAPVK